MKIAMNDSSERNISISPGEAFLREIRQDIPDGIEYDESDYASVRFQLSQNPVASVKFNIVQTIIKQQAYIVTLEVTALPSAKPGNQAIVHGQFRVNGRDITAPLSIKVKVVD